MKLIGKDNVLKVKDLTKMGYDLEQIAEENNLRGYFVREALKKIEEGADVEEVEKAIEIGLDAMQ